MNHKLILLCLCYISSFAYGQNSSAEVESKWTTTGFKQANTMGAGEAEIQYVWNSAGVRTETTLFRKARPNPDLCEWQGRCEVDSLLDRDCGSTSSNS